ncbi:MAG: Gldg family protein [Verrucomicrobiota bacterium]
MSDPTKPSFSRGRKWSIGLNVALGIVAAFALLAMANYLSVNYFQRWYLSSRTQVQLKPRTLNLLRSMTNQVQVILYYDRQDDLYSSITDLLKEYRAVNPRLTVRTVDYTRDAAEAQQIKAKYNLVNPTEKNLVIFDCDGRFKVVPGEALSQFTFEPTPSEVPGKPEFRKKLVAFNGEVQFTAAILQVISPQILRAYTLQGHGEPAIDDATDQLGLARFNAILQQNYLTNLPLVLGTNRVPEDCSLLLIIGPRSALQDTELASIQKYLDDGGRCFVALNLISLHRELGLEKLLGSWNVDVSHSTVRDAKTITGTDIDVDTFTNHPAVSSLIGSQLYLVEPRRIGKGSAATGNDAPIAREIVFSSPRSVLLDQPNGQPQSYPLMVAVEKPPGKTAAARGSMRLLVIGDSVFLGNVGITSLANSDFVTFAVNWLLDRTVLLEGLGPQPVGEYRLLMTRPQLQAVEWILLAAMPGGILVFGTLVWLRRRR